MREGTKGAEEGEQQHKERRSAFDRVLEELVTGRESSLLTKEREKVTRLEEKLIAKEEADKKLQLAQERHDRAAQEAQQRNDLLLAKLIDQQTFLSRLVENQQNHNLITPPIMAGPPATTMTLTTTVEPLPLLKRPPATPHETSQRQQPETAPLPVEPAPAPAAKEKSVSFLPTVNKNIEDEVDESDYTYLRCSIAPPKPHGTGLSQTAQQIAQFKAAYKAVAKEIYSQRSNNVARNLIHVNNVIDK